MLWLTGFNGFAPVNYFIKLLIPPDIVYVPMRGIVVRTGVEVYGLIAAIDRVADSKGDRTTDAKGGVNVCLKVVVKSNIDI